MGFFRFLGKKLGFFESCYSTIVVEAAKSCSSSSSSVSSPIGSSSSSSIMISASTCSSSSSSSSISVQRKVTSSSYSLPRVIYLPASPSSSSLIGSTTSSSLLSSLFSASANTYQIALISSTTSSFFSYPQISPKSYPYDLYSSNESTQIFSTEFPRVVVVNKHLSYLFLTRRSDPIRALAGSVPLYGKRYNRSRYAFKSIPYLTKPPFWLPPPPHKLNSENVKFIIRGRSAKKGWYRMTTDSSLKREEVTLKLIRAGGGFLIRDSDMEPVCTGEIMFSKDLDYDIRGYEMLIIASALKAIGGSTWFPLEISTDNAFVIDILRSDTLWDLRHDLQSLYKTNLCSEKLLWIYQKIMLTIEAQLIVSHGNEFGERWSWKDIRFTPMPREANFGADYLANTIQVAGESVITVPRLGFEWIQYQKLHILLLEIMDRDRYEGFVQVPVEGRKTRHDLKILAVIARNFKATNKRCF